MRSNLGSAPGLKDGGLPSQLQECGCSGLDACISKADSLLQLLKEEAEMLRKFKSDALLGILPRKERLSVELRESVLLLKEQEKESGIDEKTSADYNTLRRSLKEIAQLNESNRIFINGSLTYCNELLDCYGSSGYGPGMREAARRRPINCKGLVFRKEA